MKLGNRRAADESFRWGHDAVLGSACQALAWKVRSMTSPVAPSSRLAVTHDRQLVIGLVGGIGSGKSRWPPSSPARRPGHRRRPARPRGPATAEMRRDRRSAGAPSCSTTRAKSPAKLGAIVFADAAERRPWKRLFIRGSAGASTKRSPRRKPIPRARFIVLDAAIMLEAGWNDVCDRLVYVDTPPCRATGSRRPTARAGRLRRWTTREAAQLPLTERPLEPIMCWTTPARLSS